MRFEIFNESMISWITCCLLICICDGTNYDLKYKTGWVIISCMILVIVVNSSCSIFGIIIKLRAILKTKMERRRKTKKSNITLNQQQTDINKNEIIKNNANTSK